MAGNDNDWDFEIIRGDTFEMDVGLTDTYAEVFSNPELYVGHLVFRDGQDDDLPALLTLTSDPELVEDEDEDPECATRHVVAYLNFAATPTQTGTLPDRRCFAYAEIRKLDSTEIRRLFSARVSLRD